MFENSHRTLETVFRACEIFRVLERLDGAGVTEVAEAMGISKSSAHAYLATLREQRLIIQRGEEYRLSLRFFDLGQHVKQHHVFFEHGREQVEELARRSGEYAHLMCQQHGLEKNIHKVAGDQAIGEHYQKIKKQQSDYLHMTASGKAVLSQLPESQVREIVDHYGLEKKTEKTITDSEVLFEELETIRDQGYAVNDEEEIAGIRAVAAPIQTIGSEATGAISVSGPKRRFTGEFYEETLPALVMEQANVVEANINMEATSQEMTDS
jgi:DNA-binding IclR family transcriptional regulator